MNFRKEPPVSERGRWFFAINPPQAGRRKTFEVKTATRGFFLCRRQGGIKHRAEISSIVTSPLQAHASAFSSCFFLLPFSFFPLFTLSRLPALQPLLLPSSFFLLPSFHPLPSTRSSAFSSSFFLHPSSFFPCPLQSHRSFGILNTSRTPANNRTALISNARRRP